MEHFIIDNNSVPLRDVGEKENRSQGGQLDCVPKKSSHISRSRTNMTGSDESASPSKKAHRPKSRIPYNRLHSCPRKYISGNQYAFNEDSIAPLSNEKSIAKSVVAPLPKSKSISERVKAPSPNKKSIAESVMALTLNGKSTSESVLYPLPNGKPIPESTENSHSHSKPVNDRYRSISAESLDFKGFELKNASKCNVTRMSKSTSETAGMFIDPLPNGESISENVLAPLPSGKSISEEVIAPSPNGKSMAESTEEKSRYRFLSAVSLYIRGFELRKASKLIVKKSGVMIFITRISKSSLVTLGMFSTLFLIWACDFEEPIARIKKAMSDVLNERSRAKC